MKEKIFPKRVSFPKGEQRSFLNCVKEEMGVSWPELAELVGVHKRTMNDWKREETTMSLPALKTILKKIGWEMPGNVEIKEPFWYTLKGGREGGLAVYKKYGSIGGDPEYRKKKWYEWWEDKGKFIDRHGLFKRKSIKKPRKDTDLAEFIGIMLGDGSITPNQVQITLNRKDEKEFIEFVRRLIKKLFKLDSSVYNSKTSNGAKLYASSIELTNHLLKLGLDRGKGKKPKDIPKWIFKNLKYQKACLKGLMDTEGCMYTHTYKVNGKSYSYKKMCFRNSSQPLLESVAKVLSNLNFSPKITLGKYVSLYNSKEVKRYFNKIGTHNPKHLKRFKD